MWYLPLFFDDIHTFLHLCNIHKEFLPDRRLYVHTNYSYSNITFSPANTALCTRTVSHHKSHVSAHCAACPTGDDALLLNHQTTFARRVAPIPGADAVRTLMHIQGGPHTMPCAMPVVQPQAPEGGPG